MHTSANTISSTRHAARPVAQPARPASTSRHTKLSAVLLEVVFAGWALGWVLSLFHGELFESVPNLAPMAEIGERLSAGLGATVVWGALASLGLAAHVGRLAATGMGRPAAEPVLRSALTSLAYALFFIPLGLAIAKASFWLPGVIGNLVMGGVAFILFASALGALTTGPGDADDGTGRR